jgi:hypothetical protein
MLFPNGVDEFPRRLHASQAAGLGCHLAQVSNVPFWKFFDGPIFALLESAPRPNHADDVIVGFFLL